MPPPILCDVFSLSFVLNFKSMTTSSLQFINLLKRLQTFEFLRGLEQKTLEELAKSAAWKIYTPNLVIFWEGNIETNLYYLQYGWLKVIKTTPDGREQILRFLGPGEIFNEIGVFAKRPNPATAIALEETGIWLIHATPWNRSYSPTHIQQYNLWKIWQIVLSAW